MVGVMMACENFVVTCLVGCFGVIVWRALGLGVGPYHKYMEHLPDQLDLAYML